MISPQLTPPYPSPPHRLITNHPYPHPQSPTPHSHLTPLRYIASDLSQLLSLLPEVPLNIITYSPSQIRIQQRKRTCNQLYFFFGDKWLITPQTARWKSCFGVWLVVRVTFLFEMDNTIATTMSPHRIFRITTLSIARHFPLHRSLN